MNLRDRLAALGVSPATHDATAGAPAIDGVRDRLTRVHHTESSSGSARSAQSLETLLGARLVGEGDEQYLRIERPLDAADGAAAEDWRALWHARAARTLAPDARLHEAHPERALFIDTETTGLGGASTLVFLVGCVHWVDGRLHLTQFFMPGPASERRMMADVLTFVQSFDFLVSFNGRAFDMRAIADRFVLCGMHDGPRALEERAHIDLLHPARRIFRHALDDCRLVTIEREILRRARGDDVHGADIPAIYYDYLRTTRAQEIAAVIRHNEWDTVTLAVLGAALMRMLADPGGATHEDDAQIDPQRARRRAEQLVGLGALHVARGDADQAENALRHGLAASSPVTRYLARKRLAALHKRRGDVARALPLWQAMVEENVLSEAHPYTEIAKHLEHAVRDVRAALVLVDRALSDLPRHRPTERQDLEKRRQRLVKALSKRSATAGEGQTTTARRAPPSC